MILGLLLIIVASFILYLAGTGRLANLAKKPA